MFVNFSQSGKAETHIQARQLADFDFIHVVITTQQQQPNFGGFDVALLVSFVCGQHQRFDSGGQGHIQQGRHVFTSTLAGGWRQGLGFASGRACLRRGQCLGLFHVGGVIAVGAIHDGVFAGSRNHLELFAQITTNGTAVGGHCTVAQAKTVKDFAIGIGHDFVALLGRHWVAVKAVGVFHDELTATHQTKTGAALVTKFGLNLVKVLGQLLVAAQLLACHIGNDFFAGGLHHKVAAMAVLDAQEFGAHLFKAAGFLPQLGGLYHRHGHFNGARAVHFFAHDGFDFANDAQAHGHVVVDASAQALDHAGAHHQLMADHLGVGRRFFEGGN